MSHFRSGQLGTANNFFNCFYDSAMAFSRAMESPIPPWQFGDENLSVKFGTSGLRGLIEEIAGETTRRYVTAFARHLLLKGEIKFGDWVYVGHDFRESSPAIVEDVIAALGAQGLRVKRAGAVPTPALALAAMAKHAAAIMVTGSHIPADRNGIKFYKPEGEIDKADEQAISRQALLLVPQAGARPSAVSDVLAKIENDFVRRYAHLLPPLALLGMTIGVYQHSSVARDLLVRILESYGARAEALDRSSRFIPVDTEAVSTETHQLLKDWAETGKFDAIVSADGDGDRPLMADEAGEILRGDLLGFLAAHFLKAKTIVTPVTSNSALERLAPGRVWRCRVGSPFVIAAMEQAAQLGNKAIVGFEANGGFLTASNFGKLKALPTRDCFLPILATLFSAKSAGIALSDLPQRFPMAAALADRVENFPTDKSRALMARLSESKANLAEFLKPLGAVQAVNNLDGLRVTFEDGAIIHLRPSGNAPEFRCYVEAADPEKAASLLERGLQLLKSQINQ